MSLRKVIVLLLMLGVGSAVLVDSVEAAKKKPVKRAAKFGDKDRARNDPDKQNNVDGAVWQATFVDAATSKSETFLYRVNGGVLFDAKNVQAGKIVSMEKGLTQMTLRKPFPIEGELPITLVKSGHWKGSFTDKNGVTWKAKFDVVDR